MRLTLREIRSRVGDEACVRTALRKQATVLVRTGQADAVLVCERADVPQDFLWIQHHGVAASPRIHGEDRALALESGVVSHGDPVPVYVVDGVYRVPLPPCQVWSVETRDETVGRALLRACRPTISDRRIGGLSVYRTIADPSRMIGFLALVPDITPRDVLVSLGADDDAEWACHRLQVCWSVGRLPPGGSSLSSRVPYPRATFWARMSLGPPWEAATGMGS